MLCSDRVTIRTGRHVDWRSKNQRHPRKRIRHLKQIPSVLERVRARAESMHADNRAARTPRQKYRPRLRDIPRPTRPIGRKRCVISLRHAAPHGDDSLQPSTRRTAQHAAKPEPERDIRRPLRIEIRAAQDRDLAPARPPRQWNKPPVPKRKNALPPRRMYSLDVLKAANVVTKRRPGKAHKRIRRIAKDRHLPAPRRRQRLKLYIRRGGSSLVFRFDARFGRFRHRRIV